MARFNCEPPTTLIIRDEVPGHSEKEGIACLPRVWTQLYKIKISFCFPKRVEGLSFAFSDGV